MRRLAFAVASLALVFSLFQGVSADPPKKNSPPKAPAKEKVITTKSGLQYVDLKVGKGAMPKKGQTVTVNYVGKLTNGTVFDATSKHTDPQHPKGQPFDFRIGVGDVIPGWDEGVMTMKVGGKRKLIVPPKLGYGDNDYGPIPGKSTLIFEVELLGVK